MQSSDIASTSSPISSQGLPSVEGTTGYPVLTTDPAGVNGTPEKVCRYAALDFETATYSRDSACALSIVLMEGDKIVSTWTRLIRPPTRDFVFTYIHGISWNHVKDQPCFAELWSEALKQLEDVEFIAAHNASFDRSVLQACCTTAGLQPQKASFVCTVKVARAVWNLYPTTLADVCRHLQIPLQHHDAESDAQACAKILLKAREHGHELDQIFKRHALKPARRPRA